MNTKKHKSKEKTRELLNLLSDPAVIVNENGHLLTVNNAFEEITGLSRKEVIDKPFLGMTILPAESKAILLKNLQRRMQGAPVEPYAVSFTDKTGKTRFVEVKGKKVSYAGQSANLVVFHDITRRIENERRLNEYAKRMEALVEEKVEKIKDSEEKFRAISTCAEDAIVAVDSAGKVVYWNPAAERIFGHNKEEAVGKNVLKLIVPPRNHGFQQKFAELVQSNRGTIIGFIAIRKDGSEFPAELSAALMNFKGKSCLLGIIRDVSERQRAEEIIINAEERFRQLFNTMPSGGAVYKAVDDGADFVFVDFNQAAEEIERVAKRDLLGKRVTEVFPGIKELGLFSVFQRVYRTGQAEYLPSRTYKDQRISGWRENWVYKLPNSNIVSIYNDVTEKKKAEETLRDSEEKLRRIIKSSPDPIAVSSRDTNIIDCNPAALKTFGYSTKSEVIGRSVFEFFAEKERARAAENLAIEGEEVKNAEYIFQAKNGREFIGELSSSPVLQPSGEVACFVSTIKDITERKEKEKALLASEERFKQVAANAEEWIWEVDVHGMYTYSSPLVEKILGYKPEEIVGKKRFYDLFHPENREKLMKASLKAFEQKQAFHGFINKNVHRNGELVWLSTSGVPILDQQGKLVGYRGTDTNITGFKKAEEALRASEAKFRAITNSALDAMFMFDEKDTIVHWNSAAERIFGYTEKEVVGKQVNVMLVPPRFRKDHRKFTAKLAKSKEQIHTGDIYEFTALRKGGVEFSMEISMAPFQLNDKNYFVAIARDISERKKIELELKQSEEKYKKQFEEGLDAIFVADVETGMLIDCNRAATRLVDREKSEIVGSHQKILHPPEMIKGKFSRTFKQHIKEKEGRILETQVITKKGEIKDVVIKPNFFEVQGKKLLQGIFRDITKRKKMEAEVEQKLEMLEALTQNLGVGLTIISKDYHVLWANKFIKNNVGKVEGKQCYSSLNTLDHICPDCGVKKVFEDGVAKDSHEYTSIGIHGKPYYVELIATPLKDKDGNVTAALEFVVDIAEKKQMQNELSEYSHKLEQLVEKRTEQLQQTQTKLVKSERLAAIGELAAMVGHDLRNPLTGIKNAAYYLKKKGDTCTEANNTAMLEIIDSSIDHANRIINDLLDYSREIHLELEERTPCLLLAEALMLVQIPDKVNIIDQTRDEPKMMVDVDKMIRVFVNFIKNAIDAMPKGGTLEVRSRQKRGNVEFTFKDEGTGMSEEVKAKLFTPLFTTKAQGMGFGLAICKRVIEAHGGTIKVQSALDKGTTFTVTMPTKPKVEVGGEEEWINTQESLLSTTT